jgi:hypothetical protein
MRHRRTLPAVDARTVRNPVESAKPLLLLPMRLEYRVVETGRRPSPIRTKQRAAKPRSEILFRWYFDDSFAESRIPPPTEAEARALTFALATLNGRRWFDIDTPDVSAAFEALARATGPARAVHLLRTAGAVPDAAPEHRIGNIAALPTAVALHAYRDGTLSLLATGEPIPRDVSYGPELLDPSHWMLDFEAAAQRGMAVRITEADIVDAALEADWIIAVGLHPGDASASLDRLVADGIANGTFAFLRQDTPTNNGVELTSHELDPRPNLRRFHADATEAERGLHGPGRRAASDVLATALGVDATLLRSGLRSADPGLDDASAMLRVVMPALIEHVPDQATALGPVDNDDLVDFFAAWINARGQLPAVRFGANPYGVLPVTRLAELEASDKDATDGAMVQFLAEYALFLRGALAPVADQQVPVITPGDVDAAAKLEQTLKFSSVSRRIDVADRGSSDTAPVGCPYVDHPDHRPANYLRRLRTTALTRLPDPTSADRVTPLLYRLARLSAAIRLYTLGQFVADAGAPQTISRIQTSLGALGAGSILDNPTPGVSARLTERSRAQPRFAAVTEPDTAARSLENLVDSSIAAIVNRQTLPGFDARLFERFRAFTRQFDAALAHLEAVAARPGGSAQLEVLLFETLDLVQHRCDAWAAGLAYRRLVTRRQAGLTGLAAGYFGMLGRPRPQSITGATDGYLQAPSPEQASTAAVLRAAHLRFRSEGAFDIRLPSRRLRRALALYEQVQRGSHLAEVLGLAGERWLHDRGLDRLIAILRSELPSRDPATGDRVEIRLFDGRAFLDSSLSFAANNADRGHLEALQAALADDLDALADLVLCEAVHQRTLGNPEAANAWLQVLSGEPGPGEPVFARTHRHGHGSSHRVMLVVPAVDVTDGLSPREIAEPSLAALASTAMPSFDQAAVVVTLAPAVEPDRLGAEARLRLGDDLALTPFDLVVGGVEEVRLRVSAAFLRHWQTDPDMVAQLGPAPASLRALSASRVVRVDLDRGAVTPSSLLHLAGVLYRAVSHGRELQVGDLQAAAPVTEPLGEDIEAVRWAAAAEGLHRRAVLLANRLERAAQQLTQALDAVLVHGRNLHAFVAQGAADATIAGAARALATAAVTLQTALEETSHLGEPGALVLATSEQLSQDPDAVAEHARALIDRLGAKLARLTEAQAAIPVIGHTAAAGRAAVDVLQAALRDALDGRALPVLPPLDQGEATTPTLGTAVALASRFGAWADVRKGMALARDVGDAYRLKAFPVADAATDDETGDPSADQRPEATAPRTHFFGTLLSSAAQPALLGAVAGVVIDEWSESRPSREQTTGVAFNYDAPQSEAPQCLLLCEPPSSDWRSWTLGRAAELVAETIEWMKVRALTAEMAAPNGPWLAGGNQVAMKVGLRRPTKRGSSRPKRRIPTQRIDLTRFPDGFGSASFVADRDVRHLGGLNERQNGEGSDG